MVANNALKAFENKRNIFFWNYGTTDAIYAAWLLLEKYHKKHPPLYIVFVDLDKVFGRVSHKFI